MAIDIFTLCITFYAQLQAAWISVTADGVDPGMKAISYVFQEMTVDLRLTYFIILFQNDNSIMNFLMASRGAWGLA